VEIVDLYLSSYGLGNEPAQLSELVGGRRQAAVVPNALDFSDDLERRAASIQREMDALRAIDIAAEELDLRQFFGRADELDVVLRRIGLVWVMGGNTFVLRRALRQSGLDAVLVDYRSSSKCELVYGGYSAGSVVVTPTLRGIDLMDDPQVVPDEYQPDVIWDGLGLIGYSIVPHYRSDHPETAMAEQAVAYMHAHGLPFRTLRDGEVIIER
jgi:dipeptidase E